MDSGKTLRVAVTGAAGQIAYSFIPLICSGQVFGNDVRVELRLLDIPQAEEMLKAVVMEIEDDAYPLVANIEAGTDPNVIFKDIDVGVFIGGFPRKDGMERKDLLQINGKIFSAQGKALDTVAKKNVKCLVVANPANTNSLILQTHAPSIPKENFTCLTRLDHNRAIFQLSAKSGQPVTSVKNVIIWGNHSATQYPDVNHATIAGKPAKETITDDEWVKTTFITTVQKRGAEIIKKRKTSSAFSAAHAAKDHLRDWYLGTAEGTWVSMGVVTDGTHYDIPAGLVYSFPVTTKNFEWKIVDGLSVDEFSRGKMKVTLEELQGEKTDAFAQ